MNKLLVFLSTILLLGSCVSSKKYKNLQQEMEGVKMNLQKCNENLANCENEKTKMALDCKNQMSSLEAEAAARASK
ncbi:MAG TPA: hypothetical protein VFX48_05940, partial [Saprospiraceae bacterium]|nr:hypothetical protein [Saprospiraceae bacterium]